VCFEVSKRLVAEASVGGQSGVGFVGLMRGRLCEPSCFLERRFGEDGGKAWIQIGLVLRVGRSTGEGSR
jgi:hypothetical protein